MECLSLNKDWLIKGNMPTGEPLEIRADVPCTVHSAMMDNISGCKRQNRKNRRL